MTDPKFEAAFATFFQGVTEISTNYMKKQYASLPLPSFSVDKGSRYWRVVRDSGGRSVHCFVDTTNGDVLKAAGWKAPAKHARGNIFDAKNGLALMGEYGPAYLR